jgi:hypothetical protein
MVSSALSAIVSLISVSVPDCPATGDADARRARGNTARVPKDCTDFVAHFDFRPGRVIAPQRALWSGPASARRTAGAGYCPALAQGVRARPNMLRQHHGQKATIQQDFATFCVSD